MFLQVSRRWFRENKEDHFDIHVAAVWGAADVDISGTASDTVSLSADFLH